MQNALDTCTIGREREGEKEEYKEKTTSFTLKYPMKNNAAVSSKTNANLVDASLGIISGGQR